VHVAKSAAGHRDGLYCRRRLPGGLAPLTRLAIPASVGDVSPHPLPQKLVRNEAAGGPDAGVRHAVQGGEYLPPVAGGHQRPGLSSGDVTPHGHASHLLVYHLEGGGPLGSLCLTAAIAEKLMLAAQAAALRR
jgi:hypothetical protein